MDYHLVSSGSDYDLTDSATLSFTSLASCSTQQIPSPEHQVAMQRVLRQQDEIEIFINTVVVPALPASPARLETYRQAQEEDEVCIKSRSIVAQDGIQKGEWSKRSHRSGKCEVP